MEAQQQFVARNYSVLQVWRACQKVIEVGFAALIESDAEGIGGSGFVECIREHIHSVCSSI